MSAFLTVIGNKIGVAGNWLIYQQKKNLTDLP